MQLLMHSERMRAHIRAGIHARMHTRARAHTQPHAHALAVFNLGAAPTGKFATGAFAITAGYPVAIAWWTMEQPGFWVPVCIVYTCTRMCTCGM